MLLRLLLAIAI